MCIRDRYQRRVRDQPHNDTRATRNMASWHVQKGTKNFFCIVSGGYVLVGSMKDKTAPPEQHKAVTIEDFGGDKEQQAFIKKNLGDDVLRVTSEKVDKLLADKNKQTLAPNAE
eukprot:TRINITY_DN1155_c0_g1_i2.p1 TRINITY_DN1155_c0_g1~~TRINITY_DN1155_c0_g1_i2.p1  ORF type:complete len:113 (-),score=53.44 TRINITY_DN1155_c0_g1_i2:49-387(-)